MELAVQLCKVSKKIGFRQHTTLLQDVSFEIESGQIFGLLGPNGAGKTTTFKLLLGLASISSGTASLLGRPVPSPESRNGVGFLPEVVLPPPYLTAREYLRFHARLLGVQATAATIDQAVRMMDVLSYMDKPLGECSKGMRQRIDLARLFLGTPRLIFMDEPVSGLDPLGQSLLKEVLLRLKQSGLTIVLSSHSIGMLADICDAVAIMQNGRILQTGLLSQLLATQDSRIVIRRSNPTDPLPDPGQPYQATELPEGLVELRFAGVPSPEKVVAQLSAHHCEIVEAGPVKTTLEQVFRAVVQSTEAVIQPQETIAKEVAA